MERRRGRRLSVPIIYFCLSLSAAVCLFLVSPSVSAVCPVCMSVCAWVVLVRQFGYVYHRPSDRICSSSSSWCWCEHVTCSSVLVLSYERPDAWERASCVKESAERQNHQQREIDDVHFCLLSTPPSSQRNAALQESVVDATHLSVSSRVPARHRQQHQDLLGRAPPASSSASAPSRVHKHDQAFRCRPPHLTRAGVDANHVRLGQ